MAKMVSFISKAFLLPLAASSLPSPALRDRRLTVRSVCFIEQEALEKAREIKTKADEEFAIEKVRYREADSGCGPSSCPIHHHLRSLS